MKFRLACYLLSLLLLIAALGLIGYGVVTYRFAHPDLTETQLFLANWKAFVMGALCAILAYGMMLCGEVVDADS